MALQQFNEYSQSSYSVQVAHRLRVEHIWDTSFSKEQRAVIGHYTAEQSNAAAVKKFKGDFELVTMTILDQTHK